jgi:hypothetical protein
MLGCPDIRREISMHDSPSELVEISKLNGDFRKNYGRLIGAFLYLRSISAVRGRAVLWSGLLFVLFCACTAWLEKHGLSWLRIARWI